MPNKTFGKFKTWLGEQGAEVLLSTNQWEVVRFRTANGVSVVYTNARGNNTFTGESDKAWRLYKRGKPWRVVDRKRLYLGQRKNIIANRDGGRKCFFCGLPAIKKYAEDVTIEHLLSFSHGGSDNINNLCLACKPCNDKLGNMAVVDKIRYYVKHRQAKLLSKFILRIENYV